MVSLRNTRKGFTLLELLLVIAIIAILAGLIIFNLNPAQRLQDTNDARIRSDVESIASAASLYIIDNDGQFASLVTLPTSTIRNLTHASVPREVALSNQGYIQSIPTHPTSGQGYKIRKVSNSIKVCGQLNEGSTMFCVTK